MAKSRSTFGKRDREMAKTAKANAKRARPRHPADAKPAEPTVNPDGVSADELVERLKELHESYEDNRISLEDFDAAQPIWSTASPSSWPASKSRNSNRREQAVSQTVLPLASPACRSATSVSRRSHRPFCRAGPRSVGGSGRAGPGRLESASGT